MHIKKTVKKCAEKTTNDEDAENKASNERRRRKTTRTSVFASRRPETQEYFSRFMFLFSARSLSKLYRKTNIENHEIEMA